MRKCDLYLLSGIIPELRNKFIKDLKTQIKNGFVKTEDDAIKLAKKYLKENHHSYEETMAVVLFLDSKIDKIISLKKYKHPYFKGNTIRTLYADKWGRVWSKTVGVLKDDNELKLTYSKQFKCYHIDTLGGGMWSSKRGKTFICQYRTSIEESKEHVNPETFVSF